MVISLPPPESVPAIATAFSARRGNRVHPVQIGGYGHAVAPQIGAHHEIVVPVRFAKTIRPSGT